MGYWAPFWFFNFETIFYPLGTTPYSLSSSSADFSDSDSEDSEDVDNPAPLRKTSKSSSASKQQRQQQQHGGGRSEQAAMPSQSMPSGEILTTIP